MPYKILLAISGGIAAYKSAELVRLFKKQGMDVRCMMTQAAQSFITPLTLQTLSQQPVATDLLDPAAELGMPHIELARWPDLILIAPASANTLAKCAQGLASDLISTVYLATNLCERADDEPLQPSGVHPREPLYGSGWFSGQALLSRTASLRQHVRRRDDLHSDRGTL